MSEKVKLPKQHKSEFKKKYPLTVEEAFEGNNYTKPWTEEEIEKLEKQLGDWKLNTYPSDSMKKKMYYLDYLCVETINDEQVAMFGVYKEGEKGLVDYGTWEHCTRRVEELSGEKIEPSAK